MNKNKSLMVCLIVLLVSSSMSFTGPWEWVKEKINQMQLFYRLWRNSNATYTDLATPSGTELKMSNMPKPRLMWHLTMELDGKKIEEFRYDLSRDSDVIKKIRKNQGFGGVYLSNDSDSQIYGKYIQRMPMFQQYVENGFDWRLDNTISKSMMRWFSFIKLKYAAYFFDKGKTEIDFSVIVPYVPILWELESSLPKSLDNDDNGKEFVGVVEAMVPEGAINRNALIGDYLDLWKTYTLRFKNNKGLMKAIEQYPRSR